MVERSFTGEHLIGELDRLVAERGAHPGVLRCDNGPELMCSAMAEWASGQVGLDFIPPGQPWRNGYVESFNSRVCDECLNINSCPGPRGHHRLEVRLQPPPPALIAGLPTARPATLPAVPSIDRLSFAGDQFTGPGQRDWRRWTSRRRPSTDKGALWWVPTRAVSVNRTIGWYFSSRPEGHVSPAPQTQASVYNIMTRNT